MLPTHDTYGEYLEMRFVDMNKQEETLFLELSKDRSESADTLEKPSMRGIKHSMVEKYSDQAHFIYELLQNADDAKATSARFVLEPNRLIFSHNGSRHFSVSDPSTENDDSDAGLLGDINAITSIANSNKTVASIGKFGVGFKAVFQYTSTPHIYDPGFRFRIDRFIVPTLLTEDFPGRKKDETLFVFPFDHPERDAKKAYLDIADKLRNLLFPLLFLSTLKDIDFVFDGVIGLYGKESVETIKYENTIAEKICLTQNDGDDLYDKYLWLFSRLDECQRWYSVGFFLDAEGHLKPVNDPAFCFFPTKEVTGLNFIIHAPFLLTESREGIRAGEEHNDDMIHLLADLAADSFEHLRDIGLKSSTRLIDDNIVSIIPIDPEAFSDPENKHKVSFLPFYQTIKSKFEEAELLPTMDGYVSGQNAYWAEYQQLPQLFSNKQLGAITINKNACWAFVSIGRAETNRNNKALFAYIESLVRTNINEDVIITGRSRDAYYNRAFGVMQSLESIKGITSEFIEAQSFDWLHEFYRWLSETKHRTDISTNRPIFIDQNGHAAAAFNNDDQLILFLPVEDVSGYTVVHPELLRNPDTRMFIDDIGIKQPSLKDQIYNIILPQYKDGAEIDTDPHFILFFKYYCKCSNDEVEEFINLIKECEFLTYYNEGDSQPYRGRADSMYLPTKQIIKYFETKKGVRLLALEEYLELVGLPSEKNLISFLTELGIKKEVSIVTRTIDYSTAVEMDLPYHHSTKGNSWEEFSIEGCKEIIEYICKNKDHEKSIVLWNCLLGIIGERCKSWGTLDSILSGTEHYFYYAPQISIFQSSDAKALKESAWIKDINGNFVSSDALYLDILSDNYDTDSEYAAQLLSFLGISARSYMYDDGDEEDDSNLSDTQRKKIAFAEKLKEYGIEGEEDLAEFQEYRRQNAARKAAELARKHIHEKTDELKDNDSDDYDELFDVESEGLDEDATTDSREQIESHKLTKDLIKDIARRTIRKNYDTVSVEDEYEDTDEDEYMPSAVDYSKKIERAKEKSAAEIDKIAYFEGLHNKAVSLMQDGKYTVAWFKTLLEMESINSGEANANSKRVSISFSRVEREPGTKRTLMLKHPSRYIPQFMEDLADIPMVLHMGEQKKTIAIEVVSIKSYTLRVKMKNGADIDGIELDSVTEATIDTKSPTFLLEELRKQISALELADDFNMKDNLCENIEFVFGPPGTGKTTHLARNVIIPMMKDNRECRVLVLTPTNKSADVLVKRIMEVSDTDTRYEDWLVRFGGTGDEEIEASPVFKDKTFDIRTLSKNVTVTTIARFPYDFFMPQGARVFLYGMNWDYIVIDEASMIPAVNIVFPLYKKTPRKFIIAGDPFQIEPITSVEIWKNENIYTMVELDSFINPKTKPHQYKVELLTTQYRSVPAIGNIFSNFAYGGILKDYRSAESQRQLNVGNDIRVETLNIIKFPVSKYESIYRARYLQHSSSYQIYSALFTFEYVCFLARAISSNNPKSLFKIGIISPYRAQADMIDKLFASEKMPAEIDVQVGTIHGFQGDECDIIFAVFNTPPTISGSKDMFLNKRNIINVSISRARDYLFLVMPDDNTEGVSNLRLVKRVESLIQATDVWNEFLSPDLEDLMFGDSKYLESNAFSTSHQSVNVYGLPEKCYEVRTEDNAVDVQIHRGTSRIIITSTPGQIVADEERFKPTSSLVLSPPDNGENNEEIENPVPKVLQRTAMEVTVSGNRAGRYYLVPYKGKLKTFTIKPVVGMFILQIRSGKEKLVSVSVDEDNHIIYITRESFKYYEKGLIAPEGFELRRTYFN